MTVRHNPDSSLDSIQENPHFTLDELIASSHPVLNTSFFTNPAFLRSNGMEQFLVVQGWDVTGRLDFWLFHVEDQRVTCCNRLSSFSSDQLNSACLEVFKWQPEALIQFPDIVLEGDDPIALPHHRTSYQENWYRTAERDSPYLKKRKRSSLRRRMRRWEETLEGRKIEFQFRPCREPDIAAIISLNRESLTARGRAFHFPDKSRNSIAAVALDIGFFGGLFLDGKLVAGDVITVIDSQAWFHIGGYDNRYREFSPGNQLHQKIANELIERGVTDFNFLWGNSRWKSDAGAVRIPLETVFVSRSSSKWLSREFVNAYWPHLKQSLRNNIALLKREINKRKTD